MRAAQSPLWSFTVPQGYSPARSPPIRKHPAEIEGLPEGATSISVAWPETSPAASPAASDLDNPYDGRGLYHSKTEPAGIIAAVLLLLSTPVICDLQEGERPSTSRFADQRWKTFSRVPRAQGRSTTPRGHRAESREFINININRARCQIKCKISRLMAAFFKVKS